MQLTTSETRRNIGSVTCFLDPKMFEENIRSSNFATEEVWMPIKDITVTPSSSSTISSVSIITATLLKTWVVKNQQENQRAITLFRIYELDKGRKEENKERSI